MDDEVVGWLSGPRSTVYHLDQTHAGGEALPVTDHDVIKFDLKVCTRCASPKHNEVPENVKATAAALRTMFVVEGTDAEINQMAEDFLDELAEEGYRVTRIPQRKVGLDDAYESAFTEDPLNDPLLPDSLQWDQLSITDTQEGNTTP